MKYKYFYKLPWQHGIKYRPDGSVFFDTFLHNTYISNLNRGYYDPVKIFYTIEFEEEYIISMTELYNTKLFFEN